MFEEILDSYFRKTPFETGISEIDNLFNRGITKGSLITIAGRQGVGKTSFAISICNHLLEKDMKVRYFELKRCRSLVERQFIYAHKQKGSFRHVILPTKNGSFWEKGWLNVLHFVRNAVI